MHVTYRSYLTAGVAALGASAIALTPVQPIPNQLAPTQERAISNLSVSLASTIDPITPWVDTFKLAAQNLAQLSAFNKQDPLPLLNTIGANFGTYFTELTNGNAGVIPKQIANNVQTFFKAPWWNAPDSPIINDNTFANHYISDTLTGTFKRGPVTLLNLSHKFLFSLLPAVLTQEQVTQFKPILEFTATPYSGQAAGFISPFLGSLVQVTASFTKVGQYFQQGDVIGAINELINIPANVTNAFLNGYGNFDLTSAAAGLLPPDIKKIGLNLGGWISPPVPTDGSLVDPKVTPTKFSGGTLFDAVSVTADVTSPIAGTAQTEGLPTSARGASIGLGQLLGKALLVTPVVKATAAVHAAAAEAAPATVSASAPQKNAVAGDSNNAGSGDRTHHSGARGNNG